jgi:hypothetical protein
VDEAAPITVPDDPSSLTELIDQQAAARGRAPQEITHRLRMALAVVGLYVQPWTPAGEAFSQDAAPGGGAGTAPRGQGADSERGFLAGLLASVADRSLPGTDPAEVARGYATGMRKITGSTSPTAGGDAWWTVAQHRAAVSVALAQLPYPDAAAVPNAACKLADELLQGALQMAAQAAIVRLMLDIPPDAFIGGDVPAVTQIRAALETFEAESLVSYATFERIVGLLLAGRGES